MYTHIVLLITFIGLMSMLFEFLKAFMCLRVTKKLTILCVRLFPSTHSIYLTLPLSVCGTDLWEQWSRGKSVREFLSSRPPPPFTGEGLNIVFKVHLLHQNIRLHRVMGDERVIMNEL